jgi:predicted transposase YdaD
MLCCCIISKLTSNCNYFVTVIFTSFRTGKRTDTQTGRQTGRQADRQEGRQTKDDRYTDNTAWFVSECVRQLISKTNCFQINLIKIE